MLTHKLEFSRVARAAGPQIVAFTAISTVAVFSHLLLHHPELFGLEGTWAAELLSTLVWAEAGIPFGAIAALGSALAIFLGFRNNSAYDRWWEARKIWGRLVNDSRSFARQVIAWTELPIDVEGPPGMPADARANFRHELIYRHLAFVHGLGLHLRRSPRLLDEIKRWLGDEEIAALRKVPNVPTALLIEQGRRVARARQMGQLEHFRHLAMDRMLTNFSDIQGQCERIKNTPLPPQYDDIPRWFANFYGVILPFGLVNAMGWATIPISVVITMIFLLLEGAGRVIENPFEGQAMDTPMSALSVTIERDLLAALGETPPAALVPDAQGVLM